jgi:hypothetical protein
MPGKMKRAQILFPEADYQRLQQEAAERHCSMGELVREAVANHYLTRTQKERLAAWKRLTELKLPVSDWEQMEEEYERTFYCDLPEYPKVNEVQQNQRESGAADAQ